MQKSKELTNIKIIIAKFEVITLKKYNKNITLVNDRYLLPLEDDFLPLGFTLHMYIKPKDIRVRIAGKEKGLQYTGQVSKAYIEVGKVFVKLNIRPNSAKLIKYAKHFLQKRYKHKLNSILPDERIWLQEHKRVTQPDEILSILRWNLNFLTT